MNLKRLEADVKQYFDRRGRKPTRYDYYDVKHDMRNCCAFTAASRVNGGPHYDGPKIDAFVMEQYGLSIWDARSFVAGWSGDEGAGDCWHLGKKMWESIGKEEE